MYKISIKSEGDYFLHGKKEIPKQNYRSLVLEKAEISEDRSLELSVSSDLPYNRYWYIEELEHTPGAVDLSRFNDGAMLLFNHNRDDYIGVIEKAWLDGGKLRNKVRFDTHSLAERIYQSVKSGIIRNVSIGYLIEELVLVKKTDEINTYRATKWTPLETSLVTVPADASVGIGRSIEGRRQTDGAYKLLGKPQETAPPEGRSFPYRSINNEGEREQLKSEGSGVFIDFSANPSIPTIEVKQMSVETPQETWLKEERERCNQLLAAGKMHNCPELAEKAIASGWDILRLRSEILDAKPKQTPIARTTDPLGLDNKDKKRYSTINAIKAALNHGKFSDNCLEKEVHEALVAKDERNGVHKESRNIKYPGYDLSVDLNTASQVRNQQVGNLALGGNLVETELREESFIEIFRNASIMNAMGMRRITGLVGNLDIPKQTAGATDGNSIYWVAEDTDVSKIESQFGLVRFRPKIAGSYMYVTRSMLTQSSIPMDNYTRQELALALALGMDKAAISGTGVNEQPLGILNTPGVNAIVLGVNGDVPTHERLVQFETKIAVANAAEGSMGWAVNPKLRGELKSRQKFAGTSGETLWQNANAASNQGYVNGYMVGVSNQIPGNLSKGTGTGLSAAIFGCFNYLVCAEWGSMELAADPYDRFLSGGIRVRIIHMCDIQVTQEKAFSVATDVKTPFSDAA